MKHLLCIFFLIFFATTAFAKKENIRKPAAGESALVISYASSDQTVLKIHIYPNENYIEYFGVVMSCRKLQGSEAPKWSCFGDVESGTSEIEFVEGFKSIVASRTSIGASNKARRSFRRQGVRAQ